MGRFGCGSIPGSRVRLRLDAPQRRHNKEFQLTTAFVTLRADGRPAPNAFAAEPDVKCA